MYSTEQGFAGMQGARVIVFDVFLMCRSVRALPIVRKSTLENPSTCVDLRRMRIDVRVVHLHYLL
jgi:hypothetical protein